MANSFVRTAFAAFLATAILVVYVHASATSETRAEIVRAAGAGVIESGHVRAGKLLGSAVYNARDAKIGRVKELVIDKDGTVLAVIQVAFVGFGDKYVALNMREISIRNNHVTLDWTTDQLQQMSSYKLEIQGSGLGASSSNSNARSVTATSE